MVLGPQDLYYEHENGVYCHYHYSTRFATKCAGCDTAILNQLVKTENGTRYEYWHPECRMIEKVCCEPCISVHSDSYLKIWNVKLVSHRRTVPKKLVSGSTEPRYAEEEARETHSSLREKQIEMEKQVTRIWT